MNSWSGKGAGIALVRGQAEAPAWCAYSQGLEEVQQRVIRSEAASDDVGILKPRQRLAAGVMEPNPILSCLAECPVSDVFEDARFWPDAGAPSIDLIAKLTTASLYLQRLQWSMQIEKSHDRVQSTD